MPILTAAPDPHPKMPKLKVPPQIPNDGDLVGALLDWVPDEKTRNRILVDNASRLYGF